jgi:hypothetical protein
MFQLYVITANNNTNPPSWNLWILEWTSPLSMQIYKEVGITKNPRIETTHRIFTYLLTLFSIHKCYNITLGQVTTFITSFLNPSTHACGLEFVNTKKILIKEIKKFRAL